MSSRRRKAPLGPDHQVVIIGAGLSGIGVARDLSRAGVQDVTIFERASGVGGTWRDNTYPGIGVDVPAQAYQFRDACNPDWSRFYAKGPEVLAYVERLTDEFGVRDLIRFNSEVGERHWDDEADVWRLKVNGRDVTARFVIVAAGPFPEPKPAELPGLDDFTGTVVKSASWDQTVDLKGQRVAIIGTGASAVQIIPEIAREVGHLDVYQRTPIWIFPKFDPTTPGPVKSFFRRVPFAQRVLQESLELVYAGVLVYGVMYYANVKVIPQAVSGFLRNVTYRMAVPDKELRAKLTPDYDFGCKRPAVSSAYLQTFNRDNVDLITDPIETITATGIRTRSGTERKIDVLVLATGFRLFFDPQIYRDTPVIGRDGFNLADFYQDHQPWSYHGISTPGLPNYFQVFGQYGWTGGTWHSVVDTAAAHISRVIAEAQRLGATDVEVRKDATDAWTEKVRGRYATSLFQVGNCSTANSYYFDHNGESAYIRPMTTQAARRSSRTFPLHDYAFEGHVTPGPRLAGLVDSRFG
ncbi:NAD(P)/FAD-dependent oxidoreductase [Mycobacterium sp. CBMA271]|uniref:flavin-containing monooxygenase n=1 Tax=unclassified Mycobacteroides TaxID=2618759 RepID=UPI0012DF58A8|nr:MULTISPECIES: NAD(P)/FAD-dependent oxidoreductase [unclassified Mycobacteroides]MUM19758.1 monooxygenase [Mycobacteroides sp. CBMA 326]MUM21086.1 NAD(P)/FAD-dependent oxidoreductase [Mycobacteroides sp. CBMA 271]